MADPVSCLLAINNVRTSVQGNDPRGWMKACAEETLLKGKGGKYFKACIVGKIPCTASAIISCLSLLFFFLFPSN
jgi:hypothetical protein